MGRSGVKIGGAQYRGPTSLTLRQTDQQVTSTREGFAYSIFGGPDAGRARAALLEKSVACDPIITDLAYFRFYGPDGNLMEASQVH